MLQTYFNLGMSFRSHLMIICVTRTSVVSAQKLWALSIEHLFRTTKNLYSKRQSWRLPIVVVLVASRPKSSRLERTPFSLPEDAHVFSSRIGLIAGTWHWRWTWSRVASQPRKGQAREKSKSDGRARCLFSPLVLAPSVSPHLLVVRAIVPLSVELLGECACYGRHSSVARVGLAIPFVPVSGDEEKYALRPST